MDNFVNNTLDPYYDYVQMRSGFQYENLTIVEFICIIVIGSIMTFVSYKLKMMNLFIRRRFEMYVDDGVCGKDDNMVLARDANKDVLAVNDGDGVDKVF